MRTGALLARTPVARTSVVLASIALVSGAVASCTPASESALEALPDTTLSTSTSTSAPTTTTEPPRVCLPSPPGAGRLGLSDEATIASIELSQAVFVDCADHVVVTSADPIALATAAMRAGELGAPLLVATSEDLTQITGEIDRLRPLEVVVVGEVALPRLPETQLTLVDPDPAAAVPTTSGALLWLVDSRRPEVGAMAAAAASAIGAQTVAVHPGDVRAVDDDVRALIRERQGATLVGRFPDRSEWQIEVVMAGLEVPGGGQVMFPPGRRLIALYGSPYAASLGVLGEQSVEEAIERARQLAAEYDNGDGVVSVPSFNLITTIASAEAGEDDDYSAELSVDDIRPWVEAAGEAGVYVILDLQPGRTDFLTQAKRYEEFLRLPHVGLALDPEWRLEPDQVHLRQIGSVTAAEVNTVAEWLAGIVRDENLPQKLLVIHQFKLSMITERNTLITPAELAVLIQMDGQGPLGSKFGTYAAITDGALDSGLYWGWKNFYDEDDPTATPEQTLSAEPQPVFVSYQ
ncbi:MAG: hypothetical protein ACFCVC_09915 [Acidimicrobiia bacterium]